MPILRRLAALSLAALCLAVAPAVAQDFPTRPVRVLVGFTPGAAADIKIPVVMAFTLYLVMQPAVRILVHHHIPRGLAAWFS